MPFDGSLHQTLSISPLSSFGRKTQRCLSFNAELKMQKLPWKTILWMKRKWKWEKEWPEGIEHQKTKELYLHPSMETDECDCTGIVAKVTENLIMRSYTHASVPFVTIPLASIARARRGRDIVRVMAFESSFSTSLLPHIEFASSSFERVNDSTRVLFLLRLILYFAHFPFLPTNQSI